MRASPRAQAAPTQAYGRLQSACFASPVRKLRARGAGTFAHTSRLLQLPYERQDLLFQRFGGDRTDLLVAHRSLLVDDERLRNAIDAPVDADASVAVDNRRGVRIAEARKPAEARLRLVLVVEADDGNDLRA